MKFNLKYIINLKIKVLVAVLVAFFFIFVDRIVKIPVQIEIVLINPEEFTQQDNLFIEKFIESAKPILPDISKVTVPLDEQLDESIINNYTVAIKKTPEHLYIYTVPSLFTINESNIKSIEEYFKPAYTIDKNDLYFSEHYQHYKLRSLGLKLQERNFKSLFNFLVPLVFDYPFVNSKFAQSRNFYVYCYDDGSRSDASKYNWKKQRVIDEVVKTNPGLNESHDFLKTGNCQSIKITTIDYPTSKSKITKVYNSRLVNFDYDYELKKVDEVFTDFKLDFSSNPFMDFKEREKTRYSLFCSGIRAFYSSKIRLTHHKDCKYNQKNLAANFLENSKLYVLKTGRMFFEGSCKDLISNMHYVIPGQIKSKNNDFKIDFGSAKYEISFSDSPVYRSCVVKYNSST